jgi:predicted dehydrogenase
MPERLRVALVGCGDIGENGHASALLEHSRFKLAALCDIRPERGALLSRKTGGVPAFTDYRELLDRWDIDAAVLALRPEASVGVAIDFLRHGKPVLDEKPLALTLEDGARLAHEVAETRGVYQLGFVFRYSGLVNRVSEFARKIGTPALYQVEIFDTRSISEYEPQELARLDLFLAKSSAIAHDGSHAVDYFHLWNPAGLVRVHATATKSCPDLHGPNVWVAQFGVADGSLFQLNIGWFVAARWRVHIVGPQGTLDVDLQSGAGEFLQDGKAEKIRLDPLLPQRWACQLDAFAEAIDRGEARTATVDDGLRALRATLACETSYRERREVAISRGPEDGIPSDKRRSLSERKPEVKPGARQETALDSAGEPGI